MKDRTHDTLYLNENRYDEVKESFKFCVALARDAGMKDDSIIYDIGTAAGELPYFLQQEFPNSQIVGVEYLPELIEKAKEQVPGVEFRQGDVLDPNAVDTEASDTTFLSAVHSIFDDVSLPFNNLIRWTKPGGLVVVFGHFNPWEIDVFIRARRQSDPKDHREPGWNVVSIATVEEMLSAHPRVESLTFHPFEIAIDLPYRPEDPLRSWTIPGGGEKRLIINGLGLLHTTYCMVVRLKP